MATTSSLDSEEDEWELCNDDGFVYKRKKRRLLEAPISSLPQPPDPAEEERHRKERKRRVLNKLKEQYRKEIEHWEFLSNTLSAVEERVRKLKQQKQEEERERGKEQSELDALPSGSSLAKGLKRGYRSTVNKLLAEVEAQEAIIRNITNLCDIAEAMCEAQEESLKQCFVELPIWGSPGELLASLCDEQISSG